MLSLLRIILFQERTNSRPEYFRYLGCNPQIDMLKPWSVSWYWKMGSRGADWAIKAESSWIDQWPCFKNGLNTWRAGCQENECLLGTSLGVCCFPFLPWDDAERRAGALPWPSQPAGQKCLSQWYQLKQHVTDPCNTKLRAPGRHPQTRCVLRLWRRQRWSTVTDWVTGVVSL